MKHLKLFFALFAMLALGVGNAWGAEYQLVKSSTDLVAGCHYVIGATYNGTTYFMATTSNTNNRKLTSATVTNEKVTLTSDIMTFTLGGSNNAWTFKTDNYAGTAGYLNATSTTTSNHLKIVAADDNYNKFTFSVDANGVATITCNGKTSRHIMYLNGTTCFACYNNQTQANYVKPSLYKEVTSEPSTPAKTYDVTWMVNGEEWDTTEDVEENTQITTLPTEPTDECSGKVFQGWTDKEITDGQKPAVLFKDKSPKITDGLTTFYAVFATESSAGGGTSGSITISSTTNNFPTAYGTANTFTEYTLEGYKFKIQQVYKTGEILQWRASGNKNGTGIMYNTQKFPANIASIVVVFEASDSNKNHTLKVGTTENPTNGTSITPSKSDATYTFDCSSGSYDYFVLTNGTNAGYISSITINYGSTATPTDYTTSCSGSTEPVVSLTDEQLKWSATTATALKGADNNEFPTLTNALGLTVTYDSSNKDAATIAADGTITLLAPGTTTIYAKFAGGEVSGTKYAAKTVTYTLTVKQLVSCADIYNLADDATFVLKDFVVTYVNGKYTYIKDDTGYGLIYKDSYGLIAGDQVASGKFEGKRDSYNGLVEIIPTTVAGDLNATTGTAPEPEPMATNPIAGDMNKYVKFKNVSFASTAFSSKSINGTIEGQGSSIKFYDQFATNKTFDTSKKYDVIGVVSMFNSVQVNFISAEEVAEPTLNVKITNADFGKIAINGKAERTLTLNGSLLTNAVSLAIEGDGAEYFELASNSVTPTDGNITDAKIKITYKPTAEGTHTPTLKITSDELAEQTITLTGQAVQQHTVHFFVNGEEDSSLAAKVLHGNTLNEMPEEPISCDPLEYPTFAGWATAEISGTTDIKPTNMLDLTTIINSDCNYYAVFAKAKITKGEDVAKAYTLTIDKSFFNSTSYAANNNEKTSDAIAEDGSTVSVNWTSNQVMLQSGNVQWQKDNGYIYNSTGLGTITSIEVNSTAGSFTQYIGGAEKPTENGEGGFFQIKVGNATGKTSTIVVVFEQMVSGETTTTYEYITNCENAVPSCYVTYELEGGESDCAKTKAVVEKGTEYTLCAAPTKTGYTFLNWKDQNNTEYNASATITVNENLTLTAQWKKDSYAVIWMSLGDEVSTMQVEYNEQPTKPTNPSYTCSVGTKEFVGWTTKEIDGIGIPTNLYTDNFPAVTEAITYHAVFASKSAEAITTTSTLTNTENLGQYKAGTVTDDQGKTWNYFAGGGTEKNINLRNNTGESSYIESPKFTGIVQSISAYVKNGSTSARKVYLRSTATASPTEGDLGETTIAGNNNSNVTFTIANGKSFNQFYIQVSGGLQFNNIVVTSVIAEGAYVDYITSCEALEVSIEVNEKVEFEPIKVEKTSTKNLAIATSNFDGTLEFEISGKDATFFTYGTYSGGELPLTYQPTEGGNHEATLTITAGQVQAIVQLIGTGVEYTAGIWELVTDASTLSIDDQIVIVAKDENYALSTTQNSNNRGQAEVEKNTSNNTIAFGDDVQVLTLHAGKDEGTFALYAANYLSDGVKKNGYLYAASTTANHLKTRNNLEDNANNYWTISVTEGVATIKAKSNSKNWLMYNSNSKIFSCYDSGQSDVQIYKKKTYTRTVTPGNYGTICLKGGAKEYSGATFYEVAGKDGHKIILDEVTELEAGKPYIFYAEDEVLKITLGYETESEAGKYNSLQGTFTQIAPEETNALTGNYIIYNNLIKKCGKNCGLEANRAYFIASEMESLGLPPAQAPGRRRVAMGYESENQATGVDNITENGVIAPAMQGTYDIMGRQISEPTVTGFYIVNGKKVFVVK